VVVILIDTLRADHLGSYGYARDTTPYLDALAARSLLFENAVSAAPATFPSVNSLFSSKDAALFFRTSARDLGIPESTTTIAEVFREHGYRTAAVSSSPIVRASPSELNPGGGFGQGFEIFDEACSDSRRFIPDHVAACVTEQTAAVLEALPPEEPFFLYVHYLDPHDPYQAPSDPGGFVEPYAGKEFISKGHTWPLNKWLTTGEGEDPGVTSADIEHLKDLYDAEIRSADEALQQVMDHFRRIGRYEDTLFVVLSDHGESFLENGALQHSYSLYQTELHVPVIFHWLARWSQGRRDSRVVCSVDVFPTILELVGLATPPGLAGTAILDSEGEPLGQERVCLSAGRSAWDAGVRNLSAVRRGRWKLIHDRLEQKYRLYDLAADPGERDDRAPGETAEEAREFAELKELLASELEEALRDAPAAQEQLELSPEAEQALRALGYVE
jgi:arylsulfatase A-like enzyme